MCVCGGGGGGDGGWRTALPYKITKCASLASNLCKENPTALNLHMWLLYCEGTSETISCPCPMCPLLHRYWFQDSYSDGWWQECQAPALVSVHYYLETLYYICQWNRLCTHICTTIARISYMAPLGDEPTGGNRIGNPIAWQWGHLPHLSGCIAPLMQ